MPMWVKSEAGQDRRVNCRSPIPGQSDVAAGRAPALVVEYISRCISKTRTRHRQSPSMSPTKCTHSACTECVMGRVRRRASGGRRPQRRCETGTEHDRIMRRPMQASGTQGREVADDRQRQHTTAGGSTAAGMACTAGIVSSATQSSGLDRRCMKAVIGHLHRGHRVAGAVHSARHPGWHSEDRCNGQQQPCQQCD